MKNILSTLLLMLISSGFAQPFAPVVFDTEQTATVPLRLGNTVVASTQFVAFGLDWEYRIADQLSLQGNVMVCMVYFVCTLERLDSAGVGGQLNLRYWLNHNNQGMFAGLGRNTLAYGSLGGAGGLINSSFVEAGYRFAEGDTYYDTSMIVGYNASNQPHFGASFTTSSSIHSQPIAVGLAASNSSMPGLERRIGVSVDTTAVFASLQMDYTLLDHFMLYGKISACVYVCHLDRWSALSFGLGGSWGVKAFLQSVQQGVFLDIGSKVSVTDDLYKLVDVGAVGWRYPNGNFNYDVGVGMYTNRPDYSYSMEDSAMRVGVFLEISGRLH